MNVIRYPSGFKRACIRFAHIGRALGSKAQKKLQESSKLLINQLAFVVISYEKSNQNVLYKTSGNQVSITNAP